MAAKYLCDIKERIPWNTFVRFSRAIEEELKNDLGWETRFISDSMRDERSWIPFISTIVSLVSSPHQLYWINNKVLGPSVFGKAIKPEYEVLADGRILITLTIVGDRLDHPNFFRITEFAMSQLPGLIGLPPSKIESEMGDKTCKYWITPPPSKTLLARFVRKVFSLLSGRSAFADLSEQDEQLRENYSRLVRREAELSAIRSQLESHVEKRTLELQVANESLQLQYEAAIRRENENKQLQDRLLHLQKMEAIGALAGGISHEINNVLHGIFLSLELADLKLEDSHPAKERVLSGLKFATRGQGVMKQILAFSRKAHFESHPVDVVPIVAEAVQLMRSMLPKNVKIKDEFLTESGHAMIIGDLTQIQQLVINLCSNAADAIGSGEGEVTVAVKENPKDQLIEIKISDTGEGIAPEIANRIFDPFFTTKPVGRGTGMGLSIVHGIVTAFGGQIQVQSAPGKGTTFQMLFPRTERRVAQSLQFPTETSKNAKGSLMIVDDEADLLEVIADVLRGYGYRVTALTGALSAIEILKSAPHAFDLVITDFSMPQMTGLELARALHKIRENLPILLCTGFADELIPEGSGAKITARLRKPIDSHAMNMAIQAALLEAEQSGAGPKAST